MDILAYEFSLYFKDRKDYLKERLFKSNKYYIWKYIHALRYEEYYHDRAHESLLMSGFCIWYRRKKNKLGRILNIDIPGGVFQRGLLIWHPTSIVVNPFARVGKNATIVGNLCIGNKNGSEEAPQIGNNCVFGWDSSVIGNVVLGDNCRVGAKALVTHSFNENDAVLVGCPAKKVKKRISYEDIVYK